MLKLFVPAVFFLEALVPVHPSGVCVPLHFAVFVLAHAPEHAFSLSWYCCAVDDFPRARGSFVFVVAFVFPGGSAESSYPSASASVRGLRSPAFGCSFRAVAPMHAWS